MNEFVAAIIFIIIFIIFNNLNTKIRKLEKEISDLNYKINNTPPAQTEVIHKKNSTEETSFPQQEQSPLVHYQNIQPSEVNENISTPVQKTGLLLFLIFKTKRTYHYRYFYPCSRNWLFCKIRY